METLEVNALPLFGFDTHQTWAEDSVNWEYDQPPAIRIDKEHCKTPPYPKDRASLAAISRRPRSSSSGHTPENFRRSKISSSFMQEQAYRYRSEEHTSELQSLRHL